MKKGNIKYKNMSFPTIIEKDEDGFYVARVLNLKGCHTQSKTLNGLYKRLDEVIGLCLEVESKKKGVLSKNKFIGFQNIELVNA